MKQWLWHLKKYQRRIQWRLGKRQAKPHGYLKAIIGGILLGPVLVLTYEHYSITPPSRDIHATGSRAQHMDSAEYTINGYVGNYDIVDGDTFKLSGKRIRIWGIDTPEMSTRAGPIAKDYLKGLIAGKTVTCHQRDIDKYGRTVAQCFVGDNRDLAESLLRANQARQYCYFSKGYYDYVRSAVC